MSAPPAHRATSAHLQAAYPFVSEGSLGARGTLIGRDLLGGAFCFDPWTLYADGVLTSPNMVVVGQIGRGKSTFIKTFLWRQQAFGRQAWIIDPKGEYGPLAEAAGTTPLRISPGGDVRLNPLQLAPAGAGGPARAPAGAGGHARAAVGAMSRVDAIAEGRRQAELLSSLAAASLARMLTPAERSAIDLAVRHVATAADGEQIALPAIIAALLDPDPSMAAAVRTDTAGLAADGRQVALELRRLVEGDLAGMFDGPTSPGIDLGGPLVVLDLSALYASPALGILMTCATAWLQAALGTSASDPHSARSGPIKRLVVVDEAWAILHDLATARWLQAGFKLSRAYGAANIAVVHRLSDLRAAGAEGSAQQRLAEGLLADSETKVIFAQPPSEVALAASLLGLTSVEAELLPRLPRGVALWKVGSRSFLVEHALGTEERALVDTDAAMRVSSP